MIVGGCHYCDHVYDRVTEILSDLSVLRASLAEEAEAQDALADELFVEMTSGEPVDELAVQDRARRYWAARASGVLCVRVVGRLDRIMGAGARGRHVRSGF